jgi:hypothetical protein
MASALFGVDGLQVIEADAERDGSVTVWVVTDHPGAAVCPECGTRSVRVHEQVLARPRDVRRGLDEVRVAWLKRRWKCGNDGCARKTFTESLPAVPARCRLTERLRGLAGAEVAERGCTVAEAARWQRVSWPVAHQEFARHADPVLDQPPSLVAHLGIDEHRRGQPSCRADPDTGEYVLLADRWHTCFYDLSGDQGLLGQVEGRTADDAAYWLAQAGPAWRDTYALARSRYGDQVRLAQANMARRRVPKPHVTIKYLEAGFAALFLSALAGLMPDGSADAGYRVGNWPGTPRSPGWRWRPGCAAGSSRSCWCSRYRPRRRLRIHRVCRCCSRFRRHWPRAVSTGPPGSMRTRCMRCTATSPWTGLRAPPARCGRRRCVRVSHCW